MALGVASSSSGLSRGRSFKRRRSAPQSEINVTPLVDVMLVLLIVFMVTAPMLTVGISVDLPQSKGKALADAKEPLTVTINSDEKIFLQNSEVEESSLVSQLIGITEENRDTRIYVRGDKKLSYGKIVNIMGKISSAGYTKVALVADMPKNKSQKG